MAGTRSLPDPGGPFEPPGDGSRCAACGRMPATVRDEHTYLCPDCYARRKRDAARAEQLWLEQRQRER